MSNLKQFTAAVALGLLTATGAMAQEAAPEAPAPTPAPEEQDPLGLRELFENLFGGATPPAEEASEPRECFNYAAYSAKLEDEGGEVFVMDTEYEGEFFAKGKYTILAAPDTGSWTLVLDPVDDGVFAAKIGAPHCADTDHVFHVDGNNYGYPYTVEFESWYAEIFDKPLIQQASFEASRPFMSLKP